MHAPRQVLINVSFQGIALSDFRASGEMSKKNKKA
jgi:hypothetical protein